MKLKLALASTLLALGAATAQAADMRTPDILSSVSSDSIQKMTESEATNTRGEWRYCSNWGLGCTWWGVSQNPPSSAPKGNYLQKFYLGWGYYASR